MRNISALSHKLQINIYRFSFKIFLKTSNPAFDNNANHLVKSARSGITNKIQETVSKYHFADAIKATLKLNEEPKLRSMLNRITYLSDLIEPSEQLVEGFHEVGCR